MAVNLVFFNKNGRRKEVALDNGVTIVGRRPDCDIRIPLSHISRKHCRFVQKEDQTLVQDLGSANGTFLNSERVMEAAVAPGDKVAVGTITFTVQVDGQPSDIVPPPPPVRTKKSEEDKSSGPSSADQNHAAEPATVRENPLRGDLGAEGSPLSDFDVDEFLNEPDK